MAYQAAYIDSAGLHISSYTDIRDQMIADYKNIYGQDAYIEPDTADYQYISVLAAYINDTNQLLKIVYNNRSPNTAVGTALDSVVKMNGIRRKSASYSTCILTLAVTPPITIINGIAQDQQGNLWALPTPFIATAPVVQVTAQCTTLGAIEALPGDINIISTPTKGWISVTNNVAAIVGAPVEIDAQLRDRQTYSVATPSQSMVDSIRAGIAALAGVKRQKIYENDTNVPDENGVPGHSIAAVVEGGLDKDVGAQIYLRKAPGCGTYGTTVINYIDSQGLTNYMKFFRPTYVPVYIQVAVVPQRGYTTAINNLIIEKLSSYLKTLDIGTDVTTSTALAAALQALSDLANPTFTIKEFKMGTNPNELSTDNIIIDFISVADVGNIIVTEVVP